MMIPSAQLMIDRDRQFDDWGQTITLRHFTESVDPQTQQLIETAVDTALTAIVGPAAAQPLGENATRDLADELQVLIKAEELPTGGPTPDLRVVYAGDEYDVVRFDLTAGGLVYALACRKRL